METCLIKQDKKIIAKIYFPAIIKTLKSKNTRWFISELADDTKKIGGDYAGLKNKNELEVILEKYIFDPKSRPNLRKRYSVFLRLSKRKIISLIENCLSKCQKHLSIKKTIHIFVFPTFSDFIKKRLSGISGFAPANNYILHIYLHPDSLRIKNFNANLKKNIAHELFHIITDEYNKNWQWVIKDNIIAEGLAEIFSVNLFGGVTPFAIALSEDACRKIWPKVKKVLNSKNSVTYRDIFYEKGRYPLWTGYALGYQIVKSFLEKYPEISWRNIVKIKPDEILRMSGWK